MIKLLSANLQAFEAVSRLGTVHSAARELHLTQTGVTQRIRGLEKDLGVTLFIRSRKGMKITSEGEGILRYCKNALEMEGEALSQITNSGQDNNLHISIAGPTSIMHSRVLKQCLPHYKKWPKLFLHFVISDFDNRIELAKSGKATCVIVPPDQVPREMDSKMLKADRYVLVASTKWKGRKLSDILDKEKLIDFDEGDDTSKNYLKKFGLLSQLKNDRLYINSNELIVQLFSEGIGFGTLTQEIAKPFIDSGKIFALNNGGVLEDPLGLAWYPRKEMPESLKDIILAIR